MMRIIEDLGLETITVRELIEELQTHDADAPVFLRGQAFGLEPADTIDSYQEHELRMTQGKLCITSGCDEWEKDGETIVVIGAATPVPRCQTCSRVLDPIECDVCDDCESKVV